MQEISEAFLQHPKQSLTRCHTQSMRRHELPALAEVACMLACMGMEMHSESKNLAKRRPPHLAASAVQQTFIDVWPPDLEASLKKMN
jgi:hypothetical protein